MPRSLSVLFPSFYTSHHHSGGENGCTQAVKELLSPSSIAREVKFCYPSHCLGGTKTSRAGNVSGYRNAEHRTAPCAPWAAGTRMLWLLLEAPWPNFRDISKVWNTDTLTAQPLLCSQRAWVYFAFLCDRLKRKCLLAVRCCCFHSYELAFALQSALAPIVF